MKNKKLLLVCLFVAIGSVMFGLDTTTFEPPEFSLNSGGFYGAFDEPFIVFIQNGLRIYFKAVKYATIIAVFLLITTFLWNSFKLWFGTIDVRKVFMDVFCKVILFLTFFSAYPYILTGVIGGACRLGSELGNTDYLTERMGTLYETCMGTCLRASEAITRMFSDKTSKIPRLNEDEIKALQEVANFTSDSNLKEVITQMNPNAYGKNETNKKGNIQNHSGNGYVNFLTGTDFGSTYDITRTETKVTFGIGGSNTQSYENVIGQGTYDPIIISERQMKKNLKRIYTEYKEGECRVQAVKNTLMDVDDSLSEDELKGFKADDIKTKLNSYLLSNQYLQTKNEDDNLFKEVILSPSWFLKATMFIDHLFINLASTDWNDTTGGGKKKITAVFTKIIEMLFVVLICLLILIFAIYILIEYSVTIVEYFVVGSIGIILVPCILSDVTKRYAANLISLFVNYLFKIMLTVILSFLSMGLFLSVCLKVIFFSMSLGGFVQMLFLLLYVGLMALMLVQKVPALAQTLVTGNPSVNTGDLVRAMTTSVRGGKLAHQTAQGAGHLGQNFVQGGQTIANKMAYANMRQQERGSTNPFKWMGSYAHAGIMNAQASMLEAATGRKFTNEALAEKGIIRTSVGGKGGGTDYGIEQNKQAGKRGYDAESGLWKFNPDSLRGAGKDVPNPNGDDKGAISGGSDSEQGENDSSSNSSGGNGIAPAAQ